MHQTVADSTIVAHTLPADSLVADSSKHQAPTTAPDTLVQNMPATPLHTSDSLAAAAVSPKAIATAAIAPDEAETIAQPIDSSLFHPKDTAAAAPLNTLPLFGATSDSTDSWEMQQSAYHTEGIAGESLPYQFRNDNYVTGLLVLSFFLMVGVIVASWHFLSDNVKDFFYLRKGDNMFTDRNDTMLRGSFIAMFHTCFLLGILFSEYTQESMGAVFTHISPYKILGIGVGLCSLYFIGKGLLYKLVNNVFFDRKQVALWNNIYHLSILALGFAILPLTLLVIYFDLDYSTLRILFVCILATVKILLFYKCFQIFFDYKFGSVHLFLYFCALEILPLLVLWKSLLLASSYLSQVI